MRGILITLAAVALLAQPSVCLPHATSPFDQPHLEATPLGEPGATRSRDLYSDTLWIFDADFEDLLGDNAGWVSEDRSGTLAIPNYWHKDTIRINGFEWLGDSTWWCGTYDPCWRQPRGYGNDWLEILERSFPEVEAMTDPGDSLELRFDQRIAMENDYDYGYVDIRSPATADTWYTLIAVDNPGFAGTPGLSQDWDSTNPVLGGHIELDLTDYSGYAFDLRFRFESDMAYSSQDQFDNPPHHSVLDGAWQLDNIKLVAWLPDSVLVFLDDCESPGSNGWVHDDIPAHGQTGVTFWRGLYGTDIWTNRPYSCDEQEGWMYAAVDPLTSRMMDNEYAWFTSPPIDVSDVTNLVGQWHAWVDMPRESEDFFHLWLASNDDSFCVQNPDGFVDATPGWWYGGPFWGVWTDDWDAFAGNDWLMTRWIVVNDEPPEPGYEHWGGLFLNRVRIGTRIGPPPTEWDYDIWDRFCDTFDLAEALAHETYVRISDDDLIVSAFMVVSNDGGQTWGSYALTRQDPESTWWDVPNPSAHIAEATEVLYYFEATDGTGVTSTLPRGAPEDCYEFSVLPIVGSVSGPAVLLVDKHGRTVPGEDGGFRNTSEDYFREALDILGYDYDVFDVCVPSGVIRGDGPDTSGMKYYDTQIWASSSFEAFSLTFEDQWSLTQWLVESVTAGTERNLLLTGNDFGSWLEEGQGETLNFYSYWLASDWVQDLPMASHNPDTTAWVRDAAGGFDFMTHDNGACRLWDGCPLIAFYDVVQPTSATGAELVAEYVLPDMSVWPAGVAYTHDVWGYQTVNLGFGMEFMMDEPVGSGAFGSGAPDRVDLMANIMDYFGREPTAPPTGVEGEVFANRLGHARPNPFNPLTTIDYSLATDGRVTIRVFDAAGRVVRTLVERDVEAGQHKEVWDGTTDAGQRAASGVYFVKMEAAGHAGAFRATGKLVLLK